MLRPYNGRGALPRDADLIVRATQVSTRKEFGGSRNNGFNVQRGAQHAPDPTFNVQRSSNGDNGVTRQRLRVVH